MKNSRTKNTVLNIIFGYIALLGIKILALINRRIFLQYLPIDYLGINSLYGNIITILSLPEVGVDTAFIYLLYEPIANHNNERIASLYQWFKKLYTTLAIFVCVAGLVIVPFINLFITVNLSINNLINYYILFLLNLVLSYIMAPKVALLTASQEQRLNKIVVLISSSLLHIIQICIIKVWANFELYLFATIVTSIISNVLLEIVCSKTHKEIYIKKNKAEINKNTIVSRTKEAILYRSSAVFVGGIDDILISSLVSTSALGIYSNYFVIICSVQEFIEIISTSLLSGIGNLMNEDNLEKQNEIFDTANTFYHVIGTLGLCGFSLLINQLIIIWLGKNLLFDSLTVFMISLNFYISCIMSPITTFCEANGLFKNIKKLLIAQAIFNIIFSFIFSRVWGVCGIFVAKTLSVVTTVFWYEPKILFNTILKKSLPLYWKKQLKYYLISIIAFALCYITTSMIVDQSIIGFIIKVIIIVFVNCLLFYLVLRKTKEYKRIMNLLKDTSHLLML